jgi:DNA polymerase-3 subunit delta'
MAFSAEHAIGLLRRAFGQRRLAHAYLISGPAGSGKRDVARFLADLVAGRAGVAEGGSPNTDIHSIEPESKSRRILIDQVRQIERALQLRASGAGRKVGIIYDADRLQPQAANAFLKTLEEPPGNSILILTTAHPGLLLDTVISRCIPVPLFASGRPPWNEEQREALETMARFARVERPGIDECMRFSKRLTGRLAAVKERISGEFESELKRDEVHYKQTTESARWLEEREEQAKAATEAAYIGERNLVIDALLAFWSDVVRRHRGFDRLECPEVSDATARFAEKLALGEALWRLEALDELRENLNRGVHEALAVEAGLLKAFVAKQT